MEEVLSFMNALLFEELELEKLIWNVNVSDQECNTKRDGIRKQFYSDLVTTSFGRGAGFFNDPDVVEFSHSKLKKLKKRRLFQIKRLEGSKLGEALAREVNGADLYRCYVSNESNIDKFSMSFYLSKISGEFKIVSKDRFVLGKWEAPHNHKPTQVLEVGSTAEVLKIEAPEEALSLADYNAE